MLLLLSAYFDDFKIMALQSLAAQTKLMAIRLCKLFQAEIGHAKSQPMRLCSRFLGVFSDLRWMQQQSVFLFVAPRTLHSALDIIDSVLTTKTMSSGVASKLPGMVQWVDMEMLGRPCRGALSALIARQHFEHTDVVHERLAMSLTYLKATLCVCASRSYSLEQRVQRPTLIYTDASAEAPCDSGLRLGAVVLQDGCTYGLSLDVPTCVVDSWRHRSTYIATAELLIAPILTVACPDIFSSRDVFSFVDNQSALGSISKAASSADDMSEMALLNSLALATAHCRAWFEYVPSKLNIADALSREGWSAMRDAWTPLTIQVPWHLFQDRLDAALSYVTELG